MTTELIHISSSGLSRAVYLRKQPDVLFQLDPSSFREVDLPLVFADLSVGNELEPSRLVAPLISLCDLG